MADKQLGGWYDNPDTGTNMRWWGEGAWTTGSDPTGGRGVNWQQTQPSSQPQQQTQQPQQQSQPSQNFEAYLQQQQQAQQPAMAPAVQSLQAGIPTSQASTQAQIGQRQAEIAPLTDRYKQLLADIKGQGQTLTEQQTRVTAGELGKRGIEGSSTLAGQEIVSATRPIQQQTQSLTQQTGLAREADIRDITSQIQNLELGQQEREQAINQAISQLQAGGGQASIQNALQLLSNAQQMQVSQQTATSTQNQRDIENALAQQQFQASQQQYQQQWPYQQQLLQREINQPYFKPTSGEEETWG